MSWVDFEYYVTSKSRELLIDIPMATTDEAYSKKNSLGNDYPIYFGDDFNNIK